MAAYTLGKKERLSSKILIERLFSGGSKSFPAFPLRVVYMPVEPSEQDAAASILISVPKKRFKRAVKRNLVKRQVREAYRKKSICCWMRWHPGTKNWSLLLYGWTIIFTLRPRWRKK